MKVLGLVLTMLLLAARAASAAPLVTVVDLDDTVQPASLRYLERALEESAERDATLVVIELDTPGGLLESLREMISVILASEVPVAVYVSPAGARAASAGFFLLLAADVAAMAPGTNTGAAHPVTIGGGQGSDGEREDPAMTKVTEDAAALARSLAGGRKRPIGAAEAAVVESKSFSAIEARKRGLVEHVVADRAALLAALDGTTIARFDGDTETLELSGATVVHIERTFAERVLGVIASPQLAYLLLMIGAIGILIELTNPGLIVPGVGGAIAFLLGLYGMSVLPVSLIGALLMIAGVGLLVAEVLVTSYGVLAVAGLASFVIGSLMLIDTPLPQFQIGPEVVVPIALVLAGLTTLLALRAFRIRSQRAHTGIEAMVGEVGEAVTALAPEHEGRVFVRGEYWTATSRQPVEPGARVRVEGSEGLMLRVSAAQPTA